MSDLSIGQMTTRIAELEAITSYLPSVVHVEREECPCMANCPEVGLIEVFEGGGSHHETCPTCSGDGVVPVKCKECNGTGERLLIYAPDDGEMVVCSDCTGHGLQTTQQKVWPEKKIFVHAFEQEFPAYAVAKYWIVILVGEGLHMQSIRADECFADALSAKWMVNKLP